MCYSNSVSCIEFLRIYCIHGEVCAKILCSGKELLIFKDSKLTQNFQGNKTGFVRPGHIYSIWPHSYQQSALHRAEADPGKI